MSLIIFAFLSSLNLPYVAGGVPHAVTAEGQVIFSVPQNRGGDPTLIVGETAILTYGSGPNEGLPTVVHYDEMSRTAIVQGLARNYELKFLSLIKTDDDFELERINQLESRKVLQVNFGTGKISRMMTDSFEWFYDDGQSEQMVYKMDPARINLAGFPFTGTQAFVIVDNHTKEAVVIKPGEGFAKVPLDPYDQFPIRYRRSGVDAYTKGFTFIHDGKEYYVVTSSAGHLVVFSLNGEVKRTKTLFSPKDGKVHLGSNDGYEIVQAFGAFEGTILLADFDDAAFRYLSVAELLGSFEK